MGASFARDRYYDQAHFIHDFREFSSLTPTESLIHKTAHLNHVPIPRNAFGATERLCMKQPDGRVGHAEIQIGDSCVMMADDNPDFDAFSPKHYGGSPVSLQFYTQDCDATYHRAIAAGAKSVREPAHQSYGDRSGGIEDPFGYKWWICTHIRDLSKEQLERCPHKKHPILTGR